ncbi:hypothetical protein [Streptomyces sp. C36]|uniref:hypothetical protein n=1 Tax=Streptomyces sp. C36 TaxID=3237122 RepID=UPI0034C63143
MILFLATPPRWTPDARPTVRTRFRSALGAVVTTARRARESARGLHPLLADAP